MRKICLTEKQRQEEALERKYQKIVDGIAAYKNRERINDGILSERIGINRKSLTKFMHTESVRVDVRTMLNIIRLAGMEVKPSDP